MTDGCTKPSHYSSAGRQHAALQHRSTVYYGGAHDEIARLTAAGRWVGPAAKAAAAVSGAASACESHLRCARNSAPANGVLDTHGVVCWFCTHGQPAVGSLADMPGPERFGCATLLAARPRPPCSFFSRRSALKLPPLIVYKKEAVMCVLIGLTR